MVKKIKITEKDIISPDGIMVIDRESKIIAFNEAAQRITGFSEKEIISKNYQFLFKNIQSYQSFIEKALAKGDSYSNLSLVMNLPKGQELNVLVSITPLKPPDKSPVGVMIIFRNIEEMAFLVQQLRQKTKEILDERNKLQAIFQSTTEGTFTIDKDWKITSFNASAERITGYLKKEAVGKQCWEIFQSRVCRNGCHMECTMKSQDFVMGNELLITRKNGQKVPIRVNSAPLFEASGKQVGGVETFQDITELKNLTTHLEERYRFENIIGKSSSMRNIYSMIENVAQSDSTVLISGESGTGKELVARAIHLNSDRKMGPFTAVNCSAFAETLLESELFGHEKGAFTGAIRTKPGRFELANKGTLFLDEIGDLSHRVQVKLLRVLETREFERVGGTKPIKIDVRIISATNKNLEEEIKDGRFRDDLFYRLNVINIHLPPFRERIEDLPLLVDYFLENLRKKFKKDIKKIAPNAFRLLKSYNWPGNIRELENVLEHTFVLCHGEIIHSECLPERLWFGREGNNISATINDDPVKNAEKNYIKRTLEKHRGHRGKTAEELGIDKSTLWRKMKRYNLL